MLETLIVVLHGLGELKELAEEVVGALEGDAQLARAQGDSRRKAFELEGESGGRQNGALAAGLALVLDLGDGVLDAGTASLLPTDLAPREARRSQRVRSERATTKALPIWKPPTACMIWMAWRRFKPKSFSMAARERKGREVSSGREKSARISLTRSSQRVYRASSEISSSLCVPHSCAEL